MKPKVYIETTIISYLTSRPSRNLLVAEHQQVTRYWWNLRRKRYELYSSEQVLMEAEAGDSEAAQKNDWRLWLKRRCFASVRELTLLWTFC